MMNVFSLLGTIAINSDSARHAIDDTTQKAEKASKSMKNAFSKIGSTAVACGKVVASGLAVGTAAIGALLKSSIGEYADYEQLVGGVETLFKESKGKVMQYANEAYKTAGLSANEYMETVTSFSASLLQGLDGDTEKAAEIANKAITDMSDNANKMGTDMTMIQNAYQGFAKQNYTMLDNLKLGYGGTQEEMARLINDSGVLGRAITITAENVKDVPFHKIIEAIHVVQTEMGITGTTAKEASETISGSFSAFKATWKNLLVGLADKDADIEALFGNMMSAGKTVLENVTAVLPTFKENVSAALGELVQYIDEEMRSTVWPKLQEVFKVEFGIELPDFETFLTNVNTWWNGNNAYQKIKDVCQWTLGAFVGPNADGEGGFLGDVKTWWESTGKPSVTKAVQWTFGDLVLPAWMDYLESVSNWWENDFKPGLAAMTNWIATLKFPTWEEISESVASWWSGMKSQLEKLCTFYVSYDINRTYSQEEIDAAGKWAIDTTAGATKPVKIDSDAKPKASGMYRVPYNGYNALLHKDEAVLNRLDAREWRASQAHGGMMTDTGRLESMMGNMVTLMQQMVANAGNGQTIVLDSGVLVGQIAPQMDMQLGSIANRRGRRS